MSEKIITYLSSEMKQELKRLADKKNITMSSMMKVIIADYLYIQDKRVHPESEVKKVDVEICQGS